MTVKYRLVETELEPPPANSRVLGKFDCHKIVEHLLPRWSGKESWFVVHFATPKESTVYGLLPVSAVLRARACFFYREEDCVNVWITSVYVKKQYNTTKTVLEKIAEKLKIQRVVFDRRRADSQLAFSLRRLGLAVKGFVEDAKHAGKCPVIEVQLPKQVETDNK
jgi:hypothetical protein